MTEQHQQLLLGVNSDLVEDRRQVISDRALAQIHLAGNGWNSLAADESGDYLKLAGRQLQQGRQLREVDGFGSIEYVGRTDLGRDAPKVLFELADPIEVRRRIP